MSEAEHNAQLRVSNLQRENAAAQLRDAAADGRLTFDELTPRLDRAFGAVTRADLIAVLDDLVEAEKLHRVITDEQVLGDGPGYRWENPLLLETNSMDTIKRLGQWEVPPFMEVVTGWATVLLDFVAAKPATKLIDLVINSGGGTVVLIVPEGWGVDTERMQGSGQNTIRVKVPSRPTGDHPRLIVRGRCSGSFTARTPNGYDRWRSRRELRKQGILDDPTRPALEA